MQARGDAPIRQRCDAAECSSDAAAVVNTAGAGTPWWGVREVIGDATYGQNGPLSLL